MKVILGSQSEGRREVLSSMGYKFEILNPNINEKTIRSEDPTKLTLALANAKADALLPEIKNKEPTILITSDQVVVWDGKVREKPQTKEEARKVLASYSVKPAETVTAVVATNTANQKRVNGVDIARVWFKKIPEEVIERIIRQGEIFSHAGGFSITDLLLEEYVAEVEGAIDSVIGLPKELTNRLIREVS